MQPDMGPVCRSHLEFMKWADEAFLNALSQVPPDRIGHDLGSSFKSLFGTLNHVYLAELVWFKRLEGQQNARMADLDSPSDLTALGLAWPGLHQQWIDWSHSLAAEDWQAPLHFRTLQGGESQLPVWQIALHVVNHGSYHRGQVAAMLRQSDIKPPGTDILTFYRTR
jgi:uncharacterized damage-inducible protein DinB